MRSNMPFFQSETIKRLVRMLIFCLALFIISGCVARKPEPVETSEEKSSKEQVTQESEKQQQIVRQINAVKLNQNDQTIDIQILGNQKLVYTSIKQSFPFGIAVYLPETKIAEDFKSPMSQVESVGDIVVAYADLEKTTAKVEILLKEDFNYEVTEGNETLTVQLLGAAEKEETVKVETTQSIPALVEKPAPVKKKKAVIIPGKTASLSNIEFTTLENGKSDILIETSHPVKYDITQGKGNKIYLNLHNTIIPDHHKRPILTYYFKSAVESLMPMQMPGKSKTAKIEISTRDQVPYRIVQDENLLFLYFEASSLEPPEFTKAKKKVASGTEVIEKISQPLEQSDTLVTKKEQTAEEKAKALEEEIFGKKKEYTGDKIKLDFFETDVKNVFRILRSVGGVNFAIDRDVQGKVTLTLEDPVPWDQVLDLVLKMNNLGQIKEGNVIRIATLTTMEREEQLRQSAISARKMSLEQKKELEPLVTEYIPINYSDALEDVKPHIDKIISNRGTITVDQRTNMIILTDTQEKIEQAKEIIFRLDKVTPQIMIEAKVVEVTKNFSRELGLGLSLSERNETTVGASDFTVALNQPLSAPVNSGSFNFFRLFGSSVTQLNAQIAASETKGDVKVVSSPRILTLDNKSARIKQGLEYAYLERDDTGGSSVEFKDIDLLLEVTPHVTPDNRISMTVFLTKNDIDSITNGVPSLATNEAETELLVNNNDTIVIGGIVKTTDNKGFTGTPFLSGIPILGHLFRTDTNSDNRTELLIFITPTIVQLEQKRNIYSM